MKGVLDEKKLEELVDPEMQDNYIEEEVEQLIQIALLCRQSCPMARPKMSEVVRMLEGDGFAERWAKWQEEEMLAQKIKRIHHSNVIQVLDSTSNLSPIVLSSAR